MLAFDVNEQLLRKSPMEIAARIAADVASLTDPKSGQIISCYKIIKKLGEGGVEVVYKAEDVQFDRVLVSPR